MKRAIWAAPFLLAACGTPETFQEQSSDIQAVSQSGDRLIIEAQQTLVSEGLAATQLGGLIGEVSSGVQADFAEVAEGTTVVDIKLANTTLDNLGNEGEVAVGTFSVPIDSLRKANGDNLRGAMWLNLVDAIEIGPGIDFLANHCADPENYQADRQFCGALAANFAFE